jgi:hypothetical protein
MAMQRLPMGYNHSGHQQHHHDHCPVDDAAESRAADVQDQQA